MSAARLGFLLASLVLSGVARPLPLLLVPKLMALSLRVGGGRGFLPFATGRFGGAGGVGLALAAEVRAVPSAPLTIGSLLV